MFDIQFVEPIQQGQQAAHGQPALADLLGNLVAGAQLSREPIVKGLYGSLPGREIEDDRHRPPGIALAWASKPRVNSSIEVVLPEPGSPRINS